LGTSRYDMTGRHALVAGAAGGIGSASAATLAEAGVWVAITHHSRSPAETLAEIAAAGRPALDRQLNALDGGAVTQAVSALAVEMDGRIDVLVNCIGAVTGRRTVAETTDEHWHRTVDLNLATTLYFVRAVLPYMNQGGRIVNISSRSGLSGGSPG
jgi:3-oxoacyl-[acyl-carrier protein] reductase